MNPTTQPYEYQTPNPGAHRALKVVGSTLVVIALVAGIVAGVILTRREALNQASAASSAGGTVSIAVGGDYSPATISIKKGQSITWVNQDGRRARQISAAGDDAQVLRGFGTGEPLSKGESYSYVFEQAGTFHYYDSTASQTLGTVIVTQ